MGAHEPRTNDPHGGGARRRTTGGSSPRTRAPARSRSASTRSTLESTEENRRAYRDMLFTTPGLERVRQRRDPLRRDDPPVGARRHAVRRSSSPASGIIPGIKVDTGREAAGRLRPARRSPRGSTGCASGSQEYATLGARFAKWRAVITIGDGHPDELLHRASTRTRSARYAALCQEAGHRADRRARGADGRRQRHRALLPRRRRGRCTRSSTSCTTSGSTLEGMLLKPNMVISGKGAAEQADRRARSPSWTLQCFRGRVPAAVPGIVFLSGGQSDEQATANLNAINAHGPQPWSSRSRTAARCRRPR